MLMLAAAVPAYDRVFLTSQWREPVLAGAAIALAIAVLLRLARVWSLVAVAVSTIAFVSLSPWLVGIAPRPLVPSMDVVTLLQEVLSEGLVEIQQSPAPAEPLTGLLLTTMAGWWLITVLAHQCAVRWHRPATALVMIVILWASPLAVPLPGPIWTHTLALLIVAALVLVLTNHEPDRHGETMQA